MDAGRGNPPRGYTAALGMPLVYRSSNNHLRNPVTLVPEEEGMGRLPSPVLIKPMKIGRQWRACFLVHPLWVQPDVKAGGTSIGPLPDDALAPFLAALRDKDKWGSYEVAPINEESS